MTPVRHQSKNLIIKWCVNVPLPLLSYFLLVAYSSLNHAQAAFMVITLWAVCAWIFNTLNDAVVIVMGIRIFTSGLFVACVAMPYWRMIL